jgi:enoyl-[acyl-carrier protein] reductase III
MDENTRGASAAREGEERLEWGLVLGAASGFGAATSIALAEQAGLNVCGVDLQRPSEQFRENVVSRIESAGRKYVHFSANAANPDRRREVLDKVEQELDGSGFRMLLHSLAFGTLKPYIAEKPEDAISEENMDMTLRVMAHSLVYWVQDMLPRKLLRRGSRIYAMTSAGSQRVIPNYGAVSAAKAALESHIRQLAFELAPLGITANAIQAGVTDTPALRRIPGNEKIAEIALSRNPSGRLTTPEDVARFIALLSRPGPAADWVTGNVLVVDGGEDAVG